MKPPRSNRFGDPFEVGMQVTVYGPHPTYDSRITRFVKRDGTTYALIASFLISLGNLKPVK